MPRTKERTPTTDLYAPKPDQPKPDTPGGPPKHWHPEVSWTAGLRGEAKYGFKPNRYESQKRYGIVAALMVAGYSRGNIGAYVRSNTDWDVSEATVQNYCTKAAALIADRAETNREALKAMVAERFHDLYRRGLATGDLATSRWVTRQLGMIGEAYPDARNRTGDAMPGPLPSEPAPDTPKRQTDTDRAANVAEFMTMAANRAKAAGVVIRPDLPSGESP